MTEDDLRIERSGDRWRIAVDRVVATDRADLWAACIAGAIPRHTYLTEIESAGLSLRETHGDSGAAADVVNEVVRISPDGGQTVGGDHPPPHAGSQGCSGRVRQDLREPLGEGLGDPRRRLSAGRRRVGVHVQVEGLEDHAAARVRP